MGISGFVCFLQQLVAPCVRARYSYWRREGGCFHEQWPTFVWRVETATVLGTSWQPIAGLTFRIFVLLRVYQDISEFKHGTDDAHGSDMNQHLLFFTFTTSLWTSKTIANVLTSFPVVASFAGYDYLLHCQRHNNC